MLEDDEVADVWSVDARGWDVVSLQETAKPGVS